MLSLVRDDLLLVLGQKDPSLMIFSQLAFLTVGLGQWFRDCCILPSFSHKIELRCSEWISAFKFSFPGVFTGLRFPPLSWVLAPVAQSQIDPRVCLILLLVLFWFLNWRMKTGS